MDPRCCDSWRWLTRLATEFFPARPPYIPGGAVSGHVRAVGAGVDPAWVGRAVATRTAGTGGYAEQALAAVDGLIPVPDGMSLSDAAALMHDGVTALGLFGDAAVRAASRR